MAGDLDLPEVVLFSDGSYDNRAPVPILHEYGRLRIAIDAHAVARSPFYEGDLARNEALGLAAFRLREREEFRRQKVEQPGAGANWAGGDGRSPPYPLSSPTKPGTPPAGTPVPSLAPTPPWLPFNRTDRRRGSGRVWGG